MMDFDGKDLFESLVNSVRCKTAKVSMRACVPFESLVNSVRCKTLSFSDAVRYTFESLVNSVRCKTLVNPFTIDV